MPTPPVSKSLTRSEADITHYVERHVRDRGADSGKAMCWALRLFLRYLHHKRLNPFPLADCVPSIRRWKLASLPTYLSAAQVQEVLECCDRATALGRRDYATLMMLAKLGLRAGEVATLTHTLASWGSPVHRDRQITPVLQRFPDLMHGSAS